MSASWDRLATEAWGRRAVHIPTPSGQPPLDPRQSFATIRTAAAPFRAGTRFRTVPDVRFLTTGGRLRAPGALLPGDADTDLDTYADRLADTVEDSGWLLQVGHPLVIDFPLWSAVRDLTEQLWRQVGWPQLAVDTELTVGHKYVRTSAPPSFPAGLVWVLAGTMTVQLWRDPSTESAPEELRGAAGDLLCWPAGYRHTQQFQDRCMALHLSVDTEHRPVLATIKNLLADHAQAGTRYADHAVPYLPASPPAEADGSVAMAAPIAEVAALVSQLATGQELARAVRYQWAARRSAAGLEPVPAPRSERVVIGPQDRIRVRAEIIRLPDGPRRAIWAVNGHVLPVSGAAGDRVRAALPRGAEVEVLDLCRAVGAGDRSSQVLALLRKLHQLRAVDTVPRTANGAEP